MTGEQSNHDARRLDVHEVRIENIYNSMTRMETAIEKQSSAITTMSESLIRLAAQQEVITALSQDTRLHSDRLYDLEKSVSHLDHLPEDVRTVKDRQKTNTLVITGVIFVGSVITSAAVNAAIKLFFNA